MGPSIYPSFILHLLTRSTVLISPFTRALIRMTWELIYTKQFNGVQVHSPGKAGHLVKRHLFFETLAIIDSQPGGSERESIISVGCGFVYPKLKPKTNLIDLPLTWIWVAYGVIWNNKWLFADSPPEDAPEDLDLLRVAPGFILGISYEDWNRAYDLIGDLAGNIRMNRNGLFHTQNVSVWSSTKAIQTRESFWQHCPRSTVLWQRNFDLRALRDEAQAIQAGPRYDALAEMNMAMEKYTFGRSGYVPLQDDAELTATQRLAEGEQMEAMTITIMQAIQAKPSANSAEDKESAIVSTPMTAIAARQLWKYLTNSRMNPQRCLVYNPELSVAACKPIGDAVTNSLLQTIDTATTALETIRRPDDEEALPDDEQMNMLRVTEEEREKIEVQRQTLNALQASTLMGEMGAAHWQALMDDTIPNDNPVRGACAYFGIDTNYRYYIAETGENGTHYGEIHAGIAISDDVGFTKTLRPVLPHMVVGKFPVYIAGSIFTHMGPPILPVDPGSN